MLARRQAQPVHLTVHGAGQEEPASLRGRRHCQRADRPNAGGGGLQGPSPPSPPLSGFSTSYTTPYCCRLRAVSTIDSFAGRGDHPRSRARWFENSVRLPRSPVNERMLESKMPTALIRRLGAFLV